MVEINTVSWYPGITELDMTQGVRVKRNQVSQRVIIANVCPNLPCWWLDHFNHCVHNWDYPLSLCQIF